MEKEKKSYAHISVYCSQKEAEKWKGIAKRQGMKLSDWVREGILKNERFVDVFDSNDTKKHIVESPEVADLIAENKQLKEKIAQMESIKIQQSVVADSKILDCVTNEWKPSLTIAIEAGLLPASILDLVKTASQEKQNEIDDMIFKATSEVELLLSEIDSVQKKYLKGKGNLWRISII